MASEDEPKGRGQAVPPPLERQVISIQSHVVCGYAGNKSATFPLQLHGYDVCPVNSVHFSNHTGYGAFRGQVLNGAELLDVVSGIEANGLLTPGGCGDSKVGVHMAIALAFRSILGCLPLIIRLLGQLAARPPNPAEEGTSQPSHWLHREQVFPRRLPEGPRAVGRPV